jgi:hypothetical protein
MKENAGEPGVDDLHSAYAKAVLAFNLASAALIVHLAAGSRPTDGQIATEEESRATVVAARRKLWAVYE